MSMLQCYELEKFRQTLISPWINWDSEMMWPLSRGVYRQHAHFIVFVILQCSLNSMLFPRSLLQYVTPLTGDRMLQFTSQPSPSSWAAVLHLLRSDKTLLLPEPKKSPMLPQFVTDALPLLSLCRTTGSISLQGASWKRALINQLEVAGSPYSSTRCSI